MYLQDFNYNLPKNLIAQHPASPRDKSKLMVLNKKTGAITHSSFLNLDKFLKKGDVLVFNDTSVFKARLYGKKESGGKVEVLLLKENIKGNWNCLMKPAVKPGQKIVFSKKLEARVIEALESGKERVVKFNLNGKNFWRELEKVGQMPTPPYIKAKLKKSSEYQTTYADPKKKGSAAAPTAGLHFTKRLFKKLKNKGIQSEFVTLHVGLGTFEPVTKENIKDHQMHSEWYSIDQATYKRIKMAKSENRRIIAVGTTSVRVLETIFSQKKPKLSGETNIFIYPPYDFKVVDAMLTNFHLPKSTLIMLVSAFASPKIIKSSYHEAIRNKYRFFSFGDGMLIL